MDRGPGVSHSVHKVDDDGSVRKAFLISKRVIMFHHGHWNHIPEKNTTIPDVTCPSGINGRGRGPGHVSSSVTGLLGHTQDIHVTF